MQGGISRFLHPQILFGSDKNEFPLVNISGFLNQEAKPTTACLDVSHVLFQFRNLLDFLFIFNTEVYS